MGESCISGCCCCCCCCCCVNDCSTRYPTPESTSSNVIVLILNAGAFVFLYATGPLLTKNVMNITIAGIALIAVGLLAITKPAYRRRVAEEATAAKTAINQ